MESIFHSWVDFISIVMTQTMISVSVWVVLMIPEIILNSSLAVLNEKDQIIYILCKRIAKCYYSYIVLALVSRIFFINKNSVFCIKNTKLGLGDKKHLPDSGGSGAAGPEKILTNHNQILYF